MGIDKNEQALKLINEWFSCRDIKPFGDAAGVQLNKDELEKQAKQIWHSMLGGDPHLSEHCQQFEADLSDYKKTVVMEVLKHGSV